MRNLITLLIAIGLIGFAAAVIYTTFALIFFVILP